MVDSIQLFIARLQLFFRSLELLVGSPQFLVPRSDFIIGGRQFHVGRIEFGQDGFEPLIGENDLLPQLLHRARRIFAGTLTLRFLHALGRRISGLENHDMMR